jgi:hypothetical protein
MIYEYAVEPALVAQWAKRLEVGLAGQFGLDQRRVISDLPISWDGEVASALLEEFGYDAGSPDYEQASAFLGALLSLLTASMVKRDMKFRDGRPWLEQALEIHAQEPFHAILAREAIAGQRAVITDRVIDQLHDERWYLPTVRPVKKTADDLASILVPLLRGANKIVIVDPYFDPSKPAYREVLAALLGRAAQARGPGRKLPAVELVVGLGEERPDGGSVPPETRLENFAKYKYAWATQHLRACIPQNMRVTFRCASNFPDGDKLHNRFVLTDVGGVSLPYGTQALGAAVFDDLSLLYRGQYEERWWQFTRAGRLKTIGVPQVIVGVA